MKKTLILSVFFPFAIFSQNTWDGSTISTSTTTGGVGIGAAPSLSMSLRINNTTRNYGIYNQNSISASGVHYGIYNNLVGAAGTKYGIHNQVSGEAVNKYGIFTNVVSSGSYAGGSSASASSYALYATASGAGTRAAYFNGDVEMNNSNTIFASGNGNKVLFFANRAGSDYGLSIVINKTNHQYDWDWGSSLYISRTHMTKDISSSAKAFSIYRTDETRDVFRIYGDGRVFATEINVKLASTFPDYVFSPSYDLLPINELSGYIKNNGRLPNMPSAAKVEEEGLNVGETSRLLVEKIEELTLYIIQQQALIEKQEARLKELEEKIK